MSREGVVTCWTRLLIAALASAMSLGLGGSPLAAQGLEAVRLEDGNGQLAFWLPAPRRPDTDLTNEVRLALVFDGSPLWGRLLPSRVAGCADQSQATLGAVRREARCTTTEVEVGQDMYTPATSTVAAEPEPGQRPYAGWLFLSAAGSTVTRTKSDAVSINLGVTGRPSLAEKLQTAWHALIGYPRPLGWAHQIPFHAGASLAYEHQQEIVQASVGGIPLLSVVPFGGASVGNVLTGVHAGLDARIGYNVRPSWSTMMGGSARRLEVYALGSVREDIVGYELFLDQGTSGPTRHVAKRPLVTEYAFGGGLRWRPIEVEYRAVTRTQEYSTGRAVQPAGQLLVGVRTRW